MLYDFNSINHPNLMGSRADSSDADGDALPHLVGEASPIVWYTTLRIPTLDTIYNNPTTSVNTS
jgi:hypothetical protein